MRLLMLPPELFGMVVHHYVDLVGVDEAWKAKLVCRTFSTALTTEFFLYQPISAFTESKLPTSFASGKPSRIFRENLSLVLQGKARKQIDAHADLPSSIKRASEFLVPYNTSEADDNTKRAAALTQVCNLAATQEWRFVWEVLRGGFAHDPRSYTHPTLSPEEQVQADTLVAAAYSQNFRAMSDCLENGANLYTPSPAFGFPVTVAALYCKDESVLPWLLDRLPKRVPKKDDKSVHYQVMVNDVIGKAKQVGRYDVTVTMVDWVKEHMPSPPVELYKAWLGLALRSPSPPFLISVLSLRSPAAQKVTWDQFENLIRSSTRSKWNHRADAITEADIIEIIRILVLHGGFELNRYYWVRSPLHTAVSHGTLEIVCTLLDLGADANNPAPLPSGLAPGARVKKERVARQWMLPRTPRAAHTYPLRTAVEQNDLDKVNLLLERGAKLGGRMDTGNWNRDELLKMTAPRVQVKRNVEGGVRGTRMGEVSAMHRRLLRAVRDERVVIDLTGED